MTPKEMHIGLDLQMQKLNSNAYNNIRPEEKDWLLNESVLRFIKQRTNPKSNNKQSGFQDDVKRYDDLEELITSASVPLYKYDEDSIYGILPYNYFHYVKGKTPIAVDCNGLTNTTLVNSSEKVCIIKFKDAPTTLYNNFKIERESGSGYVTELDSNDYPYFASGIPSLSAKFELINLVLEEWNRKGNGVIVRWEKYNDTYAPNSFIFVTPFLGNLAIRITTDTVDAVGFNTVVYQKYNYSITNIQTGANRLIKTEDLDSLLGHTFGTSIPTSPITTLEKGKIIVHHQKRFIANTLNLSFIRKPRKIDINLNQSCELNPNTHEEIVDMTSQRIKAILESNNYKNIINENILTE